MDKKDWKCGFCKQGVEVEDVCGKLWHDESNKCTSHQRCMQYSASLCQFNMKKFGGFKVKQVLKEQSRGNKLRCSICSKKNNKSRIPGSATAGCAIQKCKKTFHFYCARLDKQARTQRIVMNTSQAGCSGDAPQVLYRVFCSEAHEKLFLKQETMEVTADTDNEEYKSSPSSASEPESSSGELMDEHEKSLESQERNEGSDTDGADEDDDEDEKNVMDVSMEKVVLKRQLEDAAMKHEDDFPVAKKVVLQRDINSTEESFVICFMESAVQIPQSKFESLVSRARELFGVDSNKVFMWKYNFENFSCLHTLHLLVEISQSLCDKNESQLRHLICLLDSDDISRFDEKISLVGEKHIEKCCQSLRVKINEHFENANKHFQSTVGKFCSVESLEGSVHVAYLLLCHLTDKSGEMRRHMKKAGAGEDNLCESCRKVSMSMRERDVESRLFSDLPSACAMVNNKDNTEESKLLVDWITRRADPIGSVIVYPCDNILLLDNKNNLKDGCASLSVMDLLHVSLKDLQILGDLYVTAVIIKPLNPQTTNVSGYMRRCISSVLEQHLTQQHEVCIFTTFDRCMGVTKVSDILPQAVASCKFKSFSPFDQSSCERSVSVALHFWLEL